MPALRRGGHAPGGCPIRAPRTRAKFAPAELERSDDDVDFLGAGVVAQTGADGSAVSRRAEPQRAPRKSRRRRRQSAMLRSMTSPVRRSARTNHSRRAALIFGRARAPTWRQRSEEHTSELQSLRHLVCRLLLEKKKKNTNN